MIVLRPRQEKAVSDIRGAFKAGYVAPLLRASTGFGKSAAAIYMIQSALGKGQKVWFLAHLKELLNDCASRLHEAGIPYGDIRSGFDGDRSKAVQVVSVQTAARRLDRLEKPTLIIVDEAHLAVASTYISIFEWAHAGPKFYRPGGAWLLLLTATPKRLSGEPMGEVADHIVETCSTQELIDEKLLAPIRYYAPMGPDMSGARTLAGEFNQSDVAGIMDKPSITGNAVTEYKKVAHGRPAVAFCVNIKHAENVAAEFRAAGYRAIAVSGESDTVERDAALRGLRDGQLDVVCNCALWVAGVDAPSIACIIMLAPTQSLTKYLQSIGRGLRMHPGKDCCISRDSEILTNKGLVKIQDVTLDHLVWDGLEFVQHSGSICKGVQLVIEYDGIIATPDHLVMTLHGWMPIDQAAKRRIRIVKTGSGRGKIRFPYDHFKKDGWFHIQSSGRSPVRGVLTYTNEPVSQFAKKAGNKGVPKLQRKEAVIRSEVALSKMPGTKRSLYKPKPHGIRPIRRTGGKVQFSNPLACGPLDSRESRRAKQGFANRPDRQQRGLRAGKYPMGNARQKPEQYASFGRFKPRKVSIFQSELSSNPLCGSDASSVDTKRPDGRADRGEVEFPIVQTEREVWDIHNAGPLHRFTANGRLVHNCVILDHAGNLARHGDPTQPRTWSLAAGGKPKAEAGASPVKVCPSCFATVYSGATDCSCGHHFEPKARELLKVDGDLAEVVLGGGGGAAAGQSAPVVNFKTENELLRAFKARGTRRPELRARAAYKAQMIALSRQYGMAGAQKIALEYNNARY